jgi:hypothetical protein
MSIPSEDTQLIIHPTATPWLDKPPSWVWQELHEIETRLFVGSIQCADYLHILQKYKITHVLGLVDYQRRYEGITYLTFGDITDSPKQDVQR